MSLVRQLSIAALAAPFALAACGGDDGQPDPKVCSTNSGMGVLADFSVPCDPGGNGILFTASGEGFAISGYDFPPGPDQEVAFVDGWELRYDRVLTTFDHITLSQGPDKSASDQSLCDDGSGGSVKCGTGKSVVAEVDGPFAIDLHKGGEIVNPDGDPTAAVAALTGQNKVGNAAFDPSERYAFGFEVVKATTSAKNINLDADDLADYQMMVAQGFTTLFVGTATWKGNNDGSLTGSGCTTTDPNYDFAAISTHPVHFKLGTTAPTVYRNAQNPNNDPAAPLGDEEHQRGIHTVANDKTVAQLTFHLDHMFWESFVHDSPAHFDQFAARYAGSTTDPMAVMADYKGYALTPFVDHQGHTLPWRNCLGDPLPATVGMTFSTEGINVVPGGTCDASSCTIIRDFYDYTMYNHSTFGHLNADGLSFVDRQYPSPP
ncbi:MAG TPA: hypothetical protein VHE35_03855 [Kofleriaceae bacterium]|nr:hypothetical protein [Kofleriaceae bacterium]